MRPHQTQRHRTLSLRFKLGQPYRRAQKIVHRLSKRPNYKLKREVEELRRQLKKLETKKKPTKEEIDHINVLLEKYTPLKEKSDANPTTPIHELIAAKYALETIPLSLPLNQRASVHNFIYEILIEHSKELEGARTSKERQMKARTFARSVFIELNQGDGKTIQERVFGEGKKGEMHLQRVIHAYINYRKLIKHIQL